MIDIDMLKGAPKDEPERQYYFIEKAGEIYQKKKAIKGRELTCAIITFGCQMNVRDSEKLKGILARIGYEITDSEDADFVIFNTCTVRENANNKVYGHLGRMKHLKEADPDKMIAICGCMMQEPQVIETIKSKYKFVDIVFGTHNVYKLAELYVMKSDTKETVIDIWKDTQEVVEDLPAVREFPFKSGVNIMFGCNNFCSYCIVPYVRGRERSREPEDIIAEIEALVADGVIEVMLLGQNVNSYGKTLKHPISFAELLRRIEQIDGLKRIRFMTSHPKDLSDELIEVMASSKKICRHLHLPLQSGSTEILKRMNRRYTREDYLKLVEKLKTAIPDISLTTDIIVGYPGETEQDFSDTMSICEQVRYDAAFTFIYSRRTGTPAAALKDDNSSEVINERYNRLMNKVQEISAEQASLHTGEVTDVLVETISEQNDELFTGRMSNNMLVHFKGEKSLIGSIIRVRLIECKGFYYIGEIVR